MFTADLLTSRLFLSCKSDYEYFLKLLMPSFNFYLYDLLYHFSIVKPPLVEIKVILFLFYQGTWVPVVTGTAQPLAPFSYVISFEQKSILSPMCGVLDNCVWVQLLMWGFVVCHLAMARISLLRKHQQTWFLVLGITLNS